MIDKDMLEAMGQLLAPIQSDLRTMKDDIQSLKGDVQTLKGDVQTLKGDVQTLKGDVQTLKGDVQSLKADVAQIPDMRRDINLILESQQGINEKFTRLDQVAEDVEEIKVKVTALENVTRDNTSQIRELKIAK